MPDPTASEALRTQRTVFDFGIREIETLEIRQADAIFSKRTLDVCFIVDRFKDPTDAIDYGALLDNFKAALNAINSDLRKKYLRIRYALVVLSGSDYSLATSSGMVSFVKFRKELLAVNFVNDASLVQHSYTAIEEACKRLNWSADSDGVTKAIVMLTDTPDRRATGSAPRLEFVATCLTLSMGSYRYYMTNCEGFPTFIDNELVNITGFDNPANNGTYRIVNVGSTIELYYPDGTPANDLIYEVTEGDVTITTVATSPTYSPGDPTQALAALDAINAAFSQGPTFSGSGYSDFVSASGGVLLNVAQFATPAAARATIVDLLESASATVPGIDPIYLVNDNAELTAQLETGETVTFLTRPFAISVAGSGENGLRSINLTVDNTDKQVSQLIARVKKRTAPLEITFRVYLSNDLTGPQHAPPIRLYLESVETKGSSVAGEAKFIDIQNAPFPNAYYVKRRFPTLG